MAMYLVVLFRSADLCSDTKGFSVTHFVFSYDSDRNHAPCTKNGTKAHWALIVGYLTTEEEFYVIARQGKSRYLAVWSLVSLSESNCNLRTFAQPAKHPTSNFIVPPGGISGDLGLCERAIVVNVPQKLIVV